MELNGAIPYFLLFRRGPGVTRGQQIATRPRRRFGASPYEPVTKKDAVKVIDDVAAELRMPLRLDGIPPDNAAPRRG